MSDNITLIENEVLDEYIEKAIAYDLIVENNNLRDLKGISNKEIMLRKANILSKYITFPMNFDEDIIKTLEKIYDKE